MIFQFCYGLSLLIKTRMGHPYDLKIMSDVLNLSGYLEQSMKAESYDDAESSVCSLLSV